MRVPHFHWLSVSESLARSLIAWLVVTSPIESHCRRACGYMKLPMRWLTDVLELLGLRKSRIPWRSLCVWMLWVNAASRCNRRSQRLIPFGLATQLSYLGLIGLLA